MKNLLSAILLAIILTVPQGGAAKNRNNSDQLTLAKGELTRVSMPTSVNHDYQPSNIITSLRRATLTADEEKTLRRFPYAGFVKLVREKNQTVLHCYANAGSSQVRRFWLGCEDTYIVDTKTGTRYRARGSYDPQLWNHNIGFDTEKGTLLDFPIYFPPLPDSVRDIKIYGVPAWGIHGTYYHLDSSRGEATYDKAPDLRVPQLETPANGYDPDVQDTYSVYTGAHLVAPMPERTMALWRTPETTYLAIAYEQNWAKEYWGFQPGTVLIDNATGKKYQLRKVQGLPMGVQFFIHGVSGDMVVFVLEFEPLPLTTTRISYHEADGKPFRAWGAEWHGHHINNLSVDQLRDNQSRMGYYKRVVVK